MPLTALQFKFIPVDHTALNSHSNWVTGFRDESVQIANQVEQLSEHSIRSNLNLKRIRTHWMGLLNELEFAQNQQTKVCWNDLNFNFVLRNKVLNQNIWFTKGNLPQRESLSSNSSQTHWSLKTFQLNSESNHDPIDREQGGKVMISIDLYQKVCRQSSSWKVLLIQSFVFGGEKNTWSF